MGGVPDVVMGEDFYIDVVKFVYQEVSGGAAANEEKMALAVPAPVEAVPGVTPARGYLLPFTQKSKSTEELSQETAVPEVVAGSLSSVAAESEASDPRSSTASDSSSSCCGGVSLVERSEHAVEQLKASRKQLEDEIEVSQSNLWRDSRAGGCSYVYCIA